MRSWSQGHILHRLPPHLVKRLHPLRDLLCTLQPPETLSSLLGQVAAVGALNGQGEPLYPPLKGAYPASDQATACQSLYHDSTSVEEADPLPGDHADGAPLEGYHSRQALAQGTCLPASPPSTDACLDSDGGCKLCLSPS